MFVEQRLALDRGQPLILQIVTAGVGRAAQQESALAVVLQIRRDRVKAHKGRQRDRVGAVALEGFNRVLGGGAADVAALGVQNHRHLRRGAAHVGDQALQLVFGAVGGEIGDLRLEGADQISRRIDDGGAKIVDFAGIAVQLAGKFGRFRVQADAQHGVVLALCGAQHVEKSHAAIVRSPPAAWLRRRAQAHRQAQVGPGFGLVAGCAQQVGRVVGDDGAGAVQRVNLSAQLAEGQASR